MSEGTCHLVICLGSFEKFDGKGISMTVDTIVNMDDFRDCYFTGPGTLAGRYMRMFWHPIFRSEEQRHTPNSGLVGSWKIRDRSFHFSGQSQYRQSAGTRVADRQLQTGSFQRGSCAAYRRGCRRTTQSGAASQRSPASVQLAVIARGTNSFSKELRQGNGRRRFFSDRHSKRRDPVGVSAPRWSKVFRCGQRRIYRRQAGSRLLRQTLGSAKIAAKQRLNSAVISPTVS
jgi:hypothetical protein